MPKPETPKQQKTKPRIFTPAALRWALLFTSWSFVITFVLSLGAGSIMDSMGIVSALAVLLLFILLGWVFDILGLAVATVSDKPFHSMAARRVRGANESLRLIAKAGQVTSFCSDVVGDISGIISGTTCAVIAKILVQDFGFSSFFTALVLSAIVASLTVGGKALCKNIALAKNVEIVHMMGRGIGVFRRDK